MVNMNEQLDIPALQKVMTNFMRESEKLGLTEDVMNDAVDDAMGEAVRGFLRNNSFNII